MKGKFIVIEGQGFTGKTTQAHLLAEKLKKVGIYPLETRDPGGVPEAEKIREELLERRQKGSITAGEEVDLIYQSRRLFLEELIKPSLIKGFWVISSRFSPSTFVYQGVEGGVDAMAIAEIDREIVGSFEPDLYFLLDVPEKEILERMKNDREKHSFNEEDLGKIMRRRQGYLRLATANKAKWEIVVGTGTAEQTAQRIWEAVSKRFNLPT